MELWGGLGQEHFPTPSLEKFLGPARATQSADWVPRTRFLVLSWSTYKIARPHGSGSFVCGAQERTRTSKPLRALPPQGSASTNFATWAYEILYLTPLWELLLLLEQVLLLKKLRHDAPQR